MIFSNCKIILKFQGFKIFISTSNLYGGRVIDSLIIVEF